MLRTRDEILAAIQSAHGDAVTITSAEAKALVDGHLEHRRSTNGRVPDRAHVMRKITKEPIICGKRVIIQD